MKKGTRGFGMILILAVAFLSGCALSDLDVEEKSQVAATYEAFLTNTIQAATMAIGVVTNYLDLQTESKASSGELSIYDLGKLLEKKGLGMKSTRTRDGSEVSLEEELNEVAKQFEAVIERIAPDPSLAASLDGFEMDDEGNLVMGGDMVINPKTIDGALTIELLNAEARGEDVSAILEQMGAVTESLISNNGGYISDEDQTSVVETRGFYMLDVKKWNKGIISYTFNGNVDQALRTKVVSAMTDWETKTQSVIDFVEVNDPWLKFLAGIGAYKILEVIVDNTLKTGGVSDVGAVGFARLKLNSDYMQGKPDYEYQTIRHELGHALGLKHEHQRGDRDVYVNIDWATVYNDNTEKSYEKIALTNMSYSLQWVQVKVYVLWWWFWGYGLRHVPTIEAISYTTPYDYTSIMHYWSCMTVKQTTSYNNWGKIETVYAGNSTVMHKEISEYDAQAVKQMYQ